MQLCDRHLREIDWDCFSPLYPSMLCIKKIILSGLFKALWEVSAVCALWKLHAYLISSLSGHIYSPWWHTTKHKLFIFHLAYKCMENWYCSGEKKTCSCHEVLKMQYYYKISYLAEGIKIYRQQYNLSPCPWALYLVLFNFQVQTIDVYILNCCFQVPYLLQTVSFPMVYQREAILVV